MPSDPRALIVMAQAALEAGEEEPAIAAIMRETGSAIHDPGVLSALALLQRGLDRRDLALPLLEKARALSSGDGTLAHQVAQVRWEAGLPASAAFEEAVRLLPGRADVRLGLASARLNEGQGLRALGELDAMLAANAGWYEGHAQFAQLANQCGEGARALATLERALDRFPTSGDLHLTAINLLLDAERFGEALAACERALALLGEAPQLLAPKAAALDALWRTGEAASLFARLGPPGTVGNAVWRIRHHFRAGQIRAAADLVETWLAEEGAEAIWPYAALAWRLVGDPRVEWLEQGGALVRVVDLDPVSLDLNGVVPALCALHARSGRFLDQSVRHGTQTNGPLLSSIDPPIARLRETLRATVAEHIATLAASDTRHPTLHHVPRKRPRFAGSWSVRLTGTGHHAAHHHPQGCISSALYVSLPDGLAGEEGQLVLGESPADLGLGLPAQQVVAPLPGRLVLFPSWMWHGTRPFGDGERMTVAFDIART